MRYPPNSDCGFFDGRAKWIWSREGVCGTLLDPRPTQVRYFARKVVCEPGDQVLLALSADTRYMLYLNGRLLARGPQKGDVAHQFYDVLDLSAEVAEGENVLLIRVDSHAKSFPSYAPTGPAASEMSAATVFVADGFIRTAAILAAAKSQQDAGGTEERSQRDAGGTEEGGIRERLHTDSSWWVKIDAALDFRPDEEMPSYVGFCERIDFSNLPADFYRNPDLADGTWEPATVVFAAFTPQTAEDCFLPHRLYPRFIEPLALFDRGFAAVREVRESMPLPKVSHLREGMPRTLRPEDSPEYPPEGVKPSGGGGVRVALDEDGTLKLAATAHSRFTCVLDAGVLRTAYPVLRFEGGSGARIQLKYAECLTQDGKKGDRNAVAGRQLTGYSDFITLGNGHTFWSPLHWRAFRYIELTVETAGEPLRITSLRFVDCHYPLFPAADFECSDETLNRFWSIGVRTQQACAHETYEDCPYYEQLQYSGDTQPQAWLTYAMSGDTRLPLQAIRFFHWSTLAEGITQSRYPCRPTQVIPYWSLHYLLMLHDWWMYTGDIASIREEVFDAPRVIYWFLDRREATGLVGALDGWCVADWSPEWCRDFRGHVPGAKEGPTALTHFMLIAALERVANLLRALNDVHNSARCLREAQALRRLTTRAFWDPKERLYVDSPHHRVFSQLTNAWALLIDLPKGKAKAELADSLDSRTDLCQAAYFGLYWVFDAWKKARRPDLIVKHFDSFRELVDKHVTTWPEAPDGGRSECHAWSNSATYHLLRTILGFSILEPGGGVVEVEPYVDGLTHASGVFVTRHGPVSLSYDQSRAEPFRLDVPDGVRALFRRGGADTYVGPGTHSF